MRIPVVDNGGQWTHREWRVLRDLGLETEIVPNSAPLESMRADGIVLSGGALSLEGTDTPLGRVAEWIDTVSVPVLAICVGHQFLARHFGGRVAQGSPEFGAVPLTVDRPDHPMFAGLGSPLRVWASHNDAVVRPPDGWPVLAHSPGCPIEAMAHPSRPLWGVQFHPEVEHTEGGTAIFRNFAALCRR
ncbi:MAG TPA: GMP synthase subunit A [Thermoplasmata archaeon]|nr:GMP synthase subunit A [Thermoplasmata archaeon]